MGLLDRLFGKPKPRRSKPRRVTLVSPRGRRVSMSASARAVTTLQKRGWKRS